MSYTQQDRDDIAAYGYTRAEEEQVEPIAPGLPYTCDAVRSYVSDLIEQMKNPMDPKTYRATERELITWMQLLRDLEQSNRQCGRAAA